MSECPVCGTQVDPIRDWRLRKDRLDLVTCPTCGLLMRASLPTAAELSTIYAAEYFKHETDEPVDGYADYVADARWHRDAARRRLAILDRFVRQRGALLDVGAAAGFFVAEASAQGWQAEGIDVADAMVSWGISNLGVTLRLASLESVQGAARYEAITMWDYIEHSLDPRTEVEKAHELLRRGGILALSTGDVESLVGRISGSRWHLLTPRHHNFFFGSSTLGRMLEQSGFEIVWMRHPSSWYSVAHISYKLDRTFRLRPTEALFSRIAGSRLGRVGVPANLFDIVTVVARVTG
jgi:2-polyprenyl-3-methyl-5-hydroxy-6-metoxy-1,4-benzoquinol methylase